MNTKFEANGQDRKAPPFLYAQIFPNSAKSYPDKTEEEYVARLKRMSFLDLQRECARVKLGRMTETKKMIDKLTDTYRVNTAV